MQYFPSSHKLWEVDTIRNDVLHYGLPAIKIKKELPSLPVIKLEL